LLRVLAVLGQGLVASALAVEGDLHPGEGRSVLDEPVSLESEGVPLRERRELVPARAVLEAQHETVLDEASDRLQPQLAVREILPTRRAQDEKAERVAFGQPNSNRGGLQSREARRHHEDERENPGLHIRRRGTCQSWRARARVPVTARQT